MAARPGATPKTQYCCRAMLKIAKEAQSQQHSEALGHVALDNKEKLKAFEDTWASKFSDLEDVMQQKAQEAARNAKIKHEREMSSIMSDISTRKAAFDAVDRNFHKTEELLRKQKKGAIVQTRKENRDSEREYLALKMKTMKEDGQKIYFVEKRKAMAKAMEPYIRQRETLRAQYQRERAALQPQFELATKSLEEKQRTVLRTQLTKDEWGMLPPICPHHFHYTTPVRALSKDFYHIGAPVVAPSTL